MDAGGLQPAHVLHTRRYRDSSLIVELLTAEAGRVACLARGALKGRGGALPVQPFRPLLVEWRGRGETPALVHCEAAGPPLTLAGRRLYCGLYVNELMLKLTARHDPVAAMYRDYVAALAALAGGDHLEVVLRRFEVGLLGHLGHGLTLSSDAMGRPIEAAKSYTYDIEDGARPCAADDLGAIDGATLLALTSGDLAGDRALHQARDLMRRVLNHYLEGRPLHSRELFR